MIAIYELVTRILLGLGFAAGRIWPRSRPVSWVIGVEDIATVIRQLSSVIPDSVTVSLHPHPFYSGGYDIEFRRRRAGAWERLVRRPLLLGYLAARATGFIYVGARGFLARRDRSLEFSFLAARGVRICCYFTGNDIRSIALLEQFELQSGVPTLASRYREVDPARVSAAVDAVQRRVGEEADRFADVIFTARIDQAGYLRRPTEPFLYFVDPSSVAPPRPALEGRRPVLLHAPSNPVIKGTHLVRDAVERLTSEGYDFEYVELSGVPHDEVVAELRRADVVLNQFYALMPGVFGIEALAAGCAVLQSADGRIETDLPPGSEDAWCITRPDEVVAHLRALLDDPDEIVRLGERGRQWVLRWASTESSGPRLRRILEQVAAGTYRDPLPWGSDAAA